MNTLTAAISAQPAPRVQWQRGVIWLLFLAPLFFLSYGFANHHAARLGTTAAVYFEWERRIPFIPWTIVPYWSIDLLYGLSFLFCLTPRATHRHGLRLLTVQIISVACFLLFPLRFAFERPETHGFFGALFDVLMGFDKPYNQAPSLHIGLLVVIWARFAGGTKGGWRWLTHIWGTLIGLSVLTTYQHHFIDIPTGMAVGLISLWIWPDEGASLDAIFRLARSAGRRRLALLYLLAAGICVVCALAGGGAWLGLLWPAISCVIVALNYGCFGPEGFRKEQGRHPLAIRLLCAPYILCTWLNSRWWTRHHPEPVEIADGVWLGRMPTAREMKRLSMAGLCDLTAELPAPRGTWRYANLPWLDLTIPGDGDNTVKTAHNFPHPHPNLPLEGEGTRRALLEAAHRIEELRRQGPVLVCCALGFSRSACAVAAWLLTTGRADGVDQAVARIRAHRPGIVLSAKHKEALAACHAAIPNGANHD